MGVEAIESKAIRQKTVHVRSQTLRIIVPRAVPEIKARVNERHRGIGSWSFKAVVRAI